MKEVNREQDVSEYNVLFLEHSVWASSFISYSGKYAYLSDLMTDNILSKK